MSVNVEQVRQWMASPDKNHRQAAVVALVRSGDVRAIPFLEKIADADPEAALRYFARKGIQRLRQVQPQQGAASPRPAAPKISYRDLQPQALATSLASPDEGARLKAIKLCLQYEARGMVQLLVDRLEREDALQVLSALAFAVGKLGSSANVKALLPLLQHKDARVRANTIEALEAIGGESIYVYLVPFLRDPDNRCRGNAVLALRKCGKVNVFRTLETMLSAGEVWMQDSATFCLSRLGLGPEVFRLLDLALNSEFAVVRTQASRVLETFAKRGSDRAGEMLRRLKDEGDGASPEEELFDRLAALSVASSTTTKVEAPARKDGSVLARLRDLASVPGTTREAFEARAEHEAGKRLAALQSIDEASMQPERTREDELTARLLALSSDGPGDYDVEARETSRGQRALAGLAALSEAPAEAWEDKSATHSDDVYNKLLLLKGS